MDIPAGWKQHIDNQKNAHVFQPVDNNKDILIKYYAKEPLGKKDISDWLNIKLSNSKAPMGNWLNQADVIRDTANYARGGRNFRRPDGASGHLVAVAVTADRTYARLAIMIYYDKGENKLLMKQAYEILTQVYDAEKTDANKEGRKKDIETSPPKIYGIKSGGRIKPGRYVGSLTWDQEVKRHFELILYDTGEYEFLKGYDKSGYYVYSQATGRLNMHEDFYNSSYQPKQEFCIYGIREKTGIPMIYAREDKNKFRLTWVNPVDRLSPRQRDQLQKMKNAAKGGYQFVTEPGKGISNSQIETILYTYKENYNSGGIEIDEAIYLLMKDGRVRKGLPVAPNILDVAKSRSREPDRWGWWKYDHNRYSFAWNIDRKQYSTPYGKQMRSVPIPAGTRLQGDWGGSSSFVSLDFSSVSFWGVWLDKNGRFRRYRNNSMQAGGPMANYPSDLVTGYSDDEGSIVTVIGPNVGGGTRTKNNRPDSHRIGSYEFDDYNLTLKYDNGVERRLPTFATNDSFRSIWFEGGRLSRKD
jgi:hypothetical protein